MTFNARTYIIVSYINMKCKQGGFGMLAVKISLNSIDKVKSFVNDISGFNAEFDLVSGRYVIDAKSIMGIFSLDISKPIDLNIHTETETEDIMAAIKPYLAE